MAKPIREAYGKGILSRSLQALCSGENAVCKGELSFPVQTATVTPTTDFKQLAQENPWLETEVRLGCNLSGTSGTFPSTLLLWVSVLACRTQTVQGRVSARALGVS
jgi:hypothetical protein